MASRRPAWTPPPPCYERGHGHGDAAPHGNRVNGSCGDEAFEEVVVPRGDLAPEAQGMLAGSLSDQVVGHVFYGGEIGGRMLGSDPARPCCIDQPVDEVIPSLRGFI